jgi:hypothetical protein
VATQQFCGPALVKLVRDMFSYIVNFVLKFGLASNLFRNQISKSNKIVIVLEKIMESFRCPEFKTRSRFYEGVTDYNLTTYKGSSYIYMFVRTFSTP